MDPIRIVLCLPRANGTKRPYAEDGIEEILRTTASLYLVAVVNSDEVESALRREDFKVLILPAQVHTETDHQHFLQIRPDISILIIDLAGPDTIIRFRGVGSDMLARIIKTLAAGRSAPQRTRIHWLRNEDLLLLGNSGEDDGPAAPYPNAEAHLADVKRWLTLSLLALIPEGDEETGGAPLPGWTMNAAQARALLSDSILAVNPANVWDRIQQRELATRQANRQLTLLRIAEAFDLDKNKVEKQLLWHVLAPELDGRFARVHGYLNDDLTRRRPTLSRLAQLVNDGLDAWALRRMLAGSRPFARHRLISVHVDHPHGVPATEESVAPAPELVQFLLGEGAEAVGESAGVILLLPVERQDREQEDDVKDCKQDDDAKFLIEQLRQVEGDPHAPVFLLAGGREAGAWFIRNVNGAGFPILKVDLSLQADLTPARLQRAAEGWARLATLHRATLHRAILLVTGLDQRGTDERVELARLCAEQLPDLVPALVLHGTSLEAAFSAPGLRPVRPVDHAKLTIQARARLWRERACEAGLHLSPEAAERLAAIARFDEAQIDMAINIVHGLAPDAEDHASVLCEAVRRIARSGAPSAVQLVECAFTWKDIALPNDVFAQLRSIPDQVRYAGRVLEQWGYAKRMPYGRGVAALFSGPSGTGKSMAAQILASDLCTVLYKIDLSKTVSKWLGETEKILSQIFDLAQQNSAVLFFDEADVLFAKRTEVKDAHDRYANVEVAYLLQRMEDYDGLAILTTNLKQNIDSAFLRRLRFVVDFPMPDAVQREKIWKLAFPKEAKLADNVDFKFLARRFPLAGGNIQQIAIGAAFMAAAESPKDENAPITLQHIGRATQQELRKLGKETAAESLVDVVGPRTAPVLEARA